MKYLIFVLAILTISMVATADTRITTPVNCFQVDASKFDPKKFDLAAVKFEPHTLAITISYPYTKIGLEDNENAFSVKGHFGSSNSREATSPGEGIDTSKLTMQRLRFTIEKFSTTGTKIMICQGKELGEKLDEYDQNFEAVRALAEKIEDAQN